jgi:hypothetical protein
MASTTKYRGPSSWLHIGKYLLPVGLTTSGWKPTLAPREHTPIAQLAVDHPESVTCESVGDEEAVPSSSFTCHSAGKREVRTLPVQIFPEGWVARLRGGMSYGRHCCVIGTARKAVRETGYYLDGDVQTSKQQISRWRPRYWRKRWGDDVTARWWLPPKQRIEGRVATLNARYCHNYFHWLVEIAPRLMTMRLAGLEADYYLVDCLSKYQQTALAAFGIRPEQLIQPHYKLLLEADELIVPSLPSPGCLRQFAKTLLAGLGVKGGVPYPRRVFISRRKTGTRTLANEDEIEALLRARGFETHFMEDYSLAKQAQLIYEAEIVVATHGAGLANLIFARPGTQVIEFVQAERFNYACYPKRTRFFGLNHQQVFTTSDGGKQVLNVSPHDLEAACDSAARGTSDLAAA